MPNTRMDSGIFLERECCAVASVYRQFQEESRLTKSLSLAPVTAPAYQLRYTNDHSRTTTEAARQRKRLLWFRLDSFVMEGMNSSRSCLKVTKGLLKRNYGAAIPRRLNCCTLPSTAKTVPASNGGEVKVGASNLRTCGVFREESLFCI